MSDTRILYNITATTTVDDVINNNYLININMMWLTQIAIVATHS